MSGDAKPRRRHPRFYSVTVLTPTTDGRQDPSAARLREIVDERKGVAQAEVRFVGCLRSLLGASLPQGSLSTGRSLLCSPHTPPALSRPARVFDHVLGHWCYEVNRL